MVKNRIRNILTMLLTMVLTIGCTDHLGLQTGEGDDADCIELSISVEEQADMLYQLGRQTRAAGTQADPDLVEANSFASHPLQGGPADLQVHRMPLPLVGIHPRTTSGTTAGSSDTRAALSDIAGEGVHFHDSLTIWGCVYNPELKDESTPTEDYHRFLFQSTLLKKIRGWRTSVHWPYDDGKAKYMTFCAISPAFEDLDLRLESNPRYDSSTHTLVPPTFTYTIPDEPRAQRDVVFGTSYNGDPGSADPTAIDVQAGPANPTVLYPDAATEKEQHLGQDDKVVQMQFRHILTAVRFAQGNMPPGYVIRKVELTGINSKATYAPATNTWSNHSDTPSDIKSYAMYPFKTISAWDETGAGGENVYVNDSVLFLLPQTLTATSRLNVVLYDGSSEHSVSASLAGDIWKPGYTVTYKITIGDVKGDYYLVVEPNTDYSTTQSKSTPIHGATGNSTNYYTQGSRSFEQNTVSGQSGSFRIHSFRNYKNYTTNESGINNHHAVGWKVVGFATKKDAGFHAYDDCNYTLQNDATFADDWLTKLSDKTDSEVWSKGSQSTVEITGTTGSYAELKYEIAKQERVNTSANSHKTILKDNNSVSELNLSRYTPNGGSTTGDLMTGTNPNNANIYNSANSYIVNAKGSYVIPMVYGNSYQHGVPVVNNPGDIFLDHGGHPIRYANIIQQVNSWPDLSKKDFSTEEDKAAGHKRIRTTCIRYGSAAGEGHVKDITFELLWQDVNGLFSAQDFNLNPTVSTIGLAGFSVSDNPETIQPGNCVLAMKGCRTTLEIETVYDNDDNVVSTETVSSVTADASEAEILWTWHIWMTDEVYPNANSENIDTYYPSYDPSANTKIVSLYDTDGTTPVGAILPVNLGWVPDADTWNIYEEREIWLKLQQTEGDDPQTAYLCIRQEATPELITGTSTVYQWGRPTALPMVNNIAGSTRPIYNKEGGTLTPNFQIKTVAENYIPAAIQHYDKLIKANTKSWWDNKQNNPYWNTTKTLYDPCPPGFQMPSKALLHGTVISPTTPTDGTEYKGTALNTWSGTTPEMGANKGGYFYAIKHSETIGTAQRYEPKFYIPASGYYSGNNDDGTAMTVQQKDRSVGYLWFVDHDAPTEGSIFYFQPKNTSNFNDATVKFTTEENNDARAVRPQQQ